MGWKKERDGCIRCAALGWGNRKIDYKKIHSPLVRTLATDRVAIRASPM
jgi:hypothetical protein